MNSLTIMHDKYISGELTKHEYIQKVYLDHHAQLFSYASLLPQTDIESIEIRDNKVLMTSKKYGIRMICPEGDHRVAPIESLNFGSYEEKDSNMILELTPENSIVLDIGANMGWYSLLLARQIKGTQIHAFEPIPNTYSFLRKNIILNQAKNIIVHNFGLSNKCQDLTFYFYPEGSGNASSANLSKHPNTEQITCHVERLDDFVQKNDLHVDFIKCDVEGAELFTFEGGLETLSTDNPIVFTEMLRKWAGKFNYHPNEIIDIFSSLGYLCFTAHENKLHEFKKMDDSTTETNFFFLHQKKHQEKIELLVI